ncbi:MAG: peptide-methionine (S)-S-oxide reductase [Lachnospiraceae bacterium]|nr:peptide-methionine (S)-S-oxide reductase [Lachnospiraceae bacterium]
MDVITEIEVGYASVMFLSLTYEQVFQDNTGHAQTMRTRFDEQKIWP